MPDEVRMLDNEQALLFIRGERAIIDRKIDLLKHPAIKMTTDGGNQPYRHDQVTLLAGDIRFDASRPQDYELLTEEDWLDQPEDAKTVTIHYEIREGPDHE